MSKQRDKVCKSKNIYLIHTYGINKMWIGCNIALIRIILAPLFGEQPSWFGFVNA